MQSTKGKRLWLLAAAAAPIAHFSGCGWLTAALTALTVLPLAWLPGEWHGFVRPAALVQIVWLGIVAGYLLQCSPVYWPSDNRYAVPLTILLLAACTDAAAGARIGGVVGLCMVLLAVPLGVSGGAGLKWDWLRPAASDWSPGLTLALLLPRLPAGGGKGKDLAAAGMLAVGLAALTQGVIGPEAASRLPDAFYQTARTLGYLEPVAAVAMTMGWYAVTVLLLQSAFTVGETGGIGRRTANVLVSGTAAAMLLFGWQPVQPYLSILSAIMWFLIPFLHKLNNDEKSGK